MKMSKWLLFVDRYRRQEEMEYRLVNRKYDSDLTLIFHRKFLFDRNENIDESTEELT